MWAAWSTRPVCTRWGCRCYGVASPRSSTASRTTPARSSTTSPITSKTVGAPCLVWTLLRDEHGRTVRFDVDLVFLATDPERQGDLGHVFGRHRDRLPRPAFPPRTGRLVQAQRG